MKINTTEAATAQHDGDDSTDDGDDYLVIREVETITSDSIRNLSDASASTADAHDSSTHNNNDDDEEVPTPQDHPGPPEDDIVVFATTPTPPDHDGITLCEEGCSSPTPMNDDFDDNKVNNDSNSDLQPLCGRPSITTPTQTTSSSESDFTQRSLPEDTFSFFIYAKRRSRAFWCAFLVFTFQIAIYAVLAIDITNVSDPNNPLKFPVGVEGNVRVAEFLAIVVAIITQDDVRKAVNLLRDGFDETLVSAHEGATKGKWILSIVLRGSEGILGLFLTFLLIMQSSTVIDLLLNFLAMEFVGQLDDAVFVLTREGFLGKTLQKEAKKVSCTFYNASHLSTESKTASFATFAYFGVLFAAFFAAWVTIFWKQVSGKYLCQHIFGQFGDEVVPMLGTFTGLFSRHTNSYGNRLSYINYQGDGRDGVAVLAYCLEQKRWTLSFTTRVNYYDNNGEKMDIEWDVDPCTWIAASDESTAFDVLETANSQWVVRTPEMGILPLSRHFLACRVMLIDDDNYNCRKGLSFSANMYYEGMKDNIHSCKCKRKGHGLKCKYSERCQKLDIDRGGVDIGFVKTGGTGSNSTYFASTYYPLIAEAYNRPVYTSLDYGNQDVDGFLGNNQDDDIDFIVFTGVRWILSRKSLFPGLKNVSDESELAEYFSKFHGHFTEYDTSYVSEPVYASGTLYADYDIKFDAEASFPSNLKWQYSSALAGTSLQSTFDQRLQPDLEKSSVESTFTCAECSISISDKNKSCSGEFDFPRTFNTGDLVLEILIIFVLPVCCGLLCCFACRKCYVCRKNATNAEIEEAQLIENEEIDVEKDVTPAPEAEDEDELDGHSSMTRA